MKRPLDPLQALATILIIAGIATLIHGCGSSAEGSGVNAQAFPGPNGTTCYVIYNNGSAVGGNCQ